MPLVSTHSMHRDLQTTRKENFNASLVCAGLGGTTGSIYAIVQEIPMRTPAITMGLTWGVAGYLFFASRSRLDHWLKPYTGSEASYSWWYPNTVSVLAGGLSGLATSLLVGTQGKAALKNAGSFAVLAGLAQCTWTAARHLRQDLLLQEMQTGLPMLQRTALLISDRFHKLVHATASMRWLPFRFISSDEYLERLSIHLAKTQHSMQSYRRVMDTLSERMQELTSQEPPIS